MHSALLLLIAAAALAVSCWGLLAGRRLGSKLVLFNVAALVAAGLTALLAGIGRWLGAGDALRDLYALPILISMVALPLTLYTFATICRRLGFFWARPDWGHGAVCLYAAALLVYSLRGIFALKLIYPACWRDVLWYQASVPVALACDGVAAGTQPVPVVLSSVLIAWLVLGAGLAWRDRRPRLLAALSAGIALMVVPVAWGPLPYLLGINLCFGAMLVVAVWQTLAPGGPLPDDGAAHA